MESTAYDRALEAIARMRERDDRRAADDSRTIFLTHGSRTDRATLIFHGMTASPPQFAALARYVHARGENVLVPRLPRHGHPDRLTDALGDLTSGELVTFAQRSLDVARGLGTRVRVMGFSLGGLLALWLAQHYALDGVVAIAPLLGVAVLPRALTPSLARAALRLPNAFLWWHPLERARLMPAHGYPRFPTHLMAQSLLLAAELAGIARRVPPKSPVAFVTNDGETGVSNRAVARLAKTWSAHPGAGVCIHRIRKAGFSHDVIEPLRRKPKIGKSYPVLYELLSR